MTERIGTFVTVAPVRHQLMHKRDPKTRTSAAYHLLSMKDPLAWVLTIELSPNSSDRYLGTTKVLVPVDAQLRYLYGSPLGQV